MSFNWDSGFDPGFFSDLGGLDPNAGDPGGWTPNFGGLGDTSDSSSQVVDGNGNIIDPYNTSYTNPGSYSNPGGPFPSMGGAMSGMGLGGGALVGLLPGLLQTLGGIGGFVTSQEGLGMTKDLISKADPWGSSGGRGLADQQLMSLLGQGPPKPGDTQNLPGYQAGLEAVERGAAAQGFLGSGNLEASMLQYGGQEYQQAFGNWLNQIQALQGPAASNITPGGDSAKLMGVLGQAEASKNVATMQGLAGIARAFAPTPTAAAPIASGGGGGGGGGDGFGSILGAGLSLLGGFL